MAQTDLHATATAHLAWDDRWQTPEGRAEWLVPEPDLINLMPQLQARQARHALDLGCGVGRHALYLAAQGLEVDAIDGSPSGVGFAEQAAKSQGVTVRWRQGLMTELPYDDQSFDLVVAWNVVYHGAPEVVRQTIGEVQRVLRPGGLYLGTMLTKRNFNYRRGREIAPDTFVVDGDDDKDHPHFYCDGRGLAELYAGFEIMSLAEIEHRKPGSWHWHLLAERSRQ
jgi:tellurite methyltransferase